MSTSTSDSSSKPPVAASTPMDGLSRLSELFADRSVGELAVILDRYDNDVKSAAWAILNGETASPLSPAADGTETGIAQGQGKAENEDDQKASGDNVSNSKATNLQIGIPVTGDNSSSSCTPVTSPLVGAGGTAPIEIQRLYDEGTITKEEYDTMVEADRRAACYRQEDGGDEYNAEGQNEQQPQPQAQLSQRLQFLSSKLQQINLPRLIDQMERDQEVADHLNFINEETAQEVEHKRMVREAEAMSMDIMKQHLEEYLRAYPRSTYESWIGALHPDNIVEGKLVDDAAAAGGTTGSTTMEIDHRFYVEDSDHRRLWNDSLSEQNDGDKRDFVPAKSSRDGDSTPDPQAVLREDDEQS
mmetsp:Transcript_22733/g.49340  ORF Transcript_22733/g.49340 Transcript_22733/m.49340 type:complete len:358 (+) Transcript_22733:259-1332(+)